MWQRNFTMKTKLFYVLLCLVGCNFAYSNEDVVENSQELDSVEITAYRFAMNELDVPVNSQVLNREEIEDSVSSTIPEVLMKKANIRFMSYTGGFSDGNIAMRGFGEQSQTRILILVDGVKYNPADMAGINWSTIPLANVENIEVLRGSQSTMYGGNAEAGVIKITTIKQEEGYDCFANGMYGSYGLYNADARISGREGDAYFSASVSRYNTDGYRDFSEAWSNYASLMCGYDITETTSITLKGDYCESSVQYPNALDWQTFQENPRYAGTANMAFKDKTGLYTANLNSTSDSASFDITAGVRFRDRKIYDDGAIFPKYNNQWTYSFSPRLEITSIEDTSIFAGVDTNFSTITLDEFSYAERFNMKFSNRQADVERFDVGGYVGATYDIADDIILSGGARVDTAYTGAKWSTYSLAGRKNPVIVKEGDYDDSVWEMGVSGDAGITYKLTNEQSLYARFDQIFHYPTTDEIAYYQSSSAKPFNNDLEAEHGQNYEVGYKLKNKEWNASVNAFAMYLQNEISWDDTQKLNINLDPTLRYGVDFGGGYDSKYWGASLFGTFVRAKFLGGKYDGCDVPLVARFNGTFQVYAKPLEYITILARATYFSNSVMGNDYDNTMRKIPSYYTLDFQVNINPTKYFTIFGAIENATDENYASYGYAGSFYPSIGRVLKIGINIKL